MKRTRLISIIKKEIIQIRRDRASFGIAVMFPIVMTLLFGYAVTTDVEHIALAVFDEARGQESRALVQAYANSGYFDVDFHVNSKHALEQLIDRGRAKAGLIIPPGYGAAVQRGETPQVQLIIDGADPTIARTALSNGILVAQAHGEKLRQERLYAQGITQLNAGGVDLRTRVWYNPNMQSEQFMIPGLIGLIMQNLTVMLTAFALVRERERGTIEQLMVTPIKPSELILGKLIPYIIIGYSDFLLVLVFGVFWFGVPVLGNVPLLLILGFGFTICALAIGILISTMAKTQLQAMQMTLAFLLPSVLLSGFIFPREAMPVVIRLIGDVIPLTYFLDILRGIILKGVGLNYLWQPVLILGVLGTALLVLATVRFRKKLD